MKKLNSTDALSNLLSGYNPAFADGFSNRVIESIDANELKQQTDHMEFLSIFRWVALTGIAAIIVLLFSVYISEGSFSADAIYGIIDYTSDEPIIASLNY